jgi:hypothetical protein
MTTPKTALGLALLLPVAAFAGITVGGASGLGIFLGFALGATLAGISVAWQAHCLRYRPEHASRAQLAGFAIKLGAAAVFAAAFRFVEPLADTVSWRSFLLAFAAAAILVLPLALLDLSRLMAEARARSAAAQARRLA